MLPWVQCGGFLICSQIIMALHNISTFEFSNLNDSICLGLTGFLDEPPVDPPIDFDGPGANQQDPNQKNPRNPPGDSLISYPSKTLHIFLFVTLQHNCVLSRQRYCLHFYTVHLCYVPDLLAPSFSVTIRRFELNTDTLKRGMKLSKEIVPQKHK